MSEAGADIDFKCPHCKAVWATRGNDSSYPDLEIRVCRQCKQIFRTHDVEWPHMILKEKANYLLPQYAVAFMLFSPFFVLYPAFMLTDALPTPQRYFMVPLTVLAGCALLFLPLLLAKLPRI